MRIYTVHEPGDVFDPVRRADRTIFIREGFSVWAFVFGWVFLLRHRLWLAALVWLVLAVALGAFGRVLHVPPGSLVLLGGLMHLFVGVEGNDLRRWALDRRGMSCVGLVSGGDLAEAELAYFHREADEARPASRPAASPPPHGEDPADVIGMFPGAAT